MDYMSQVQKSNRSESTSSSCKHETVRKNVYAHLSRISTSLQLDFVITTFSYKHESVSALSLENATLYRFKQLPSNRCACVCEKEIDRK